MHSLAGKVVGAAGIGALLFTYGCGTNSAAGLRTQDVAAAQPGSPVIVSCEPNQRTLVRPAVVNGQAISQVECVTTGEALVNTGLQAPVAQATPVAYRTAPQFVQSARNDGLGDAQVVQPGTYPVTRTAARPVAARQVVYDEPRSIRPKRTVKKSAIIIGSSAGVGAGVGAAVGGKKGALIGAVIGGGGATLWDQLTRRK
jgi:hypothetical protein